MNSRVYRSRVRLSLTRKETEALLAMISEVMAGEVHEILNRDARLVAAAERAECKIRRARDEAEGRDQAKGRGDTRGSASV